MNPLLPLRTRSDSDCSAPTGWKPVRTALLPILLFALTLTGCGGGLGLRSDGLASMDYDSSAAFPVPQAIRPNVDFWRQVYGVWSRGQVAFHDDEHMGVVYEVARLPGPIEEGYTNQQRRWVRARKAMYRDQLRALESKVRRQAPLSSTDKALLAKIEDGAGRQAVYGAADRLRSQRGVRERFHRGLEISGRYDTHFRETMRARGVPEDLAYLPHVESSFQTHARSSVGAAGIWQFMPATGRDYGMRVDATIDERLDPITCADGAARYLSAAHRKLGNWPLAITSYNHGKGGMANAKAQHGSDIGRIVKHYKGRAFGFASRNFYASFVAAREVAEHPNRYFPEGVRYEEPWSYDRIVLRSRMPAEHVAQHYGVPTARLGRLNLHWRERALDGRAQLPGGTTVWLPEGSLKRVAGLPPAYREPISVPATATLVARHDSSSAQGAASASRASSARLVSDGERARPTTKTAPKYHIVKPDETLYRVAINNGISVEKLRRLNGLDPGDNTIRVGQRLKVSG
jgi:membrane-bound lytic murein transglycosylase D